MSFGGDETPAGGLEPPGLRLHAGSSGDRSVLAVAGELDLATRAEFLDAALARLAEGPLLLDLRELSFLDSSGVHALDALIGEADRTGHALTVAPVLHAHVRRVLELTGMLFVLPMEPA